MKTATETRESDLMIIQTVFKNRKRFAFATLVACEANKRWIASRQMMKNEELCLLPGVSLTVQYYIITEVFALRERLGIRAG